MATLEKPILIFFSSHYKTGSQIFKGVKEKKGRYPPGIMPNWICSVNTAGFHVPASDLLRELQGLVLLCPEFAGKPALMSRSHPLNGRTRLTHPAVAIGR